MKTKALGQRMTRTVKMRIELDVIAAGVLTHAARGTDPATAATLPDFAVRALTAVAALLAAYRAEWTRLVESRSDMPENVVEEFVDIENLLALGEFLAAFTDREYLGTEAAFERRAALEMIGIAQREAEIEVPVPVIWTPEAAR